MLSFTDIKVSAENLTTYRVSWSHVCRIWQFRQLIITGIETGNETKRDGIVSLSRGSKHLG